MNDRARALRNTMFSSVGIYTEYFLGMLTAIFIARHLGPTDYGKYSAMIWLVAMGVAMTNSGTASAVIKFVAELRGAGRDDLIAATIGYLRRAQRWFLAAILGIGGLLFLFAGEHVAPGLDHVKTFAFLVISIALRAQYMFNVGIAKGFEDFRATAIVASIATPLNLAMVVVAWWLDAEVWVLFAVFVLSSAVFFAISHWQTAPLIPPAPEGVVLPDALMKRVRRHMRLVAVTVSVGFIAASEVEVFFLNFFKYPAQAGQFKVAYQLASGAAMLVPGVIGALLLPMMANALSQGRDVAARRFVASTTYLALLAAPLAAFGAVFCGPIIELMYGVEYAPAAPVFAACLFACAVATTSQGGSSLLVSADRQLTILVLVVGCGVLKVVLDLVLIRSWGLTGAMYAYLAVALVNAVLIVGLALRTIGLHPDWARLARILLAAALAAAAAWPLRGHWPPLPTLLLAALGFSAVYAILTLLLRCWTQADLEHIAQLHARFARGRPRMVARLLAWSARPLSKESP
ncbi:MAG: polysaccharide biosynthesis protein [Lysobacteraceae bacterium]|nr:MAG: polysaccharide biosynthesis protein [Xanthomonadaceae bacterium]